MGTRITDLHCKEVICLNDGKRLGFISDVEIRVPEGEVLAIIVPAACKPFGFQDHRHDFVIPWKNICRIGPDIVLVDCDPDNCRVPRPKRLWIG